MKAIDCGDVREAIPDAVRGDRPVSAAVEGHLLACDTCRAELELVRWLRRTRPSPPAGLDRRLSVAVREVAGARRHPAWALTAAAVAALALGIGLSSGSGPDLAAPPFAQEFTEEWPWTSEDGLVAGAPVFDELSDRDLTVLLADLDLERMGP